MLWGALLALGCGAPSQAVAPGIYTYESVALVETCTPALAVGTGTTVLSLAGDTLSVMLLQGSADSPVMRNVEVPPEGFHAQQDIDGPPQCGGPYHLSTDVDLVAYGDPLELNVRQAFRGAAAATGPCLGAPPAGDCRSEQRVTLRLVQACDDVRSPRPGQYVCADAGL
jgi:hypothetical protein